MKYDNTIKYLKQLDSETLIYIYKDVCDYDGSFDECNLYTIEDFRNSYDYNAWDIAEDLIEVGKADYYYFVEGYGWYGLDASEVHDHLAFWLEDLAEWLYKHAMFYYDYAEAEFVYSGYEGMPVMLCSDESFLLALLKDLAFNNGFIGLLNDADKLLEVVESY